MTPERWARYHPPLRRRPRAAASRTERLPRCPLLAGPTAARGGRDVAAQRRRGREISRGRMLLPPSTAVRRGCGWGRGFRTADRAGWHGRGLGSLARGRQFSAACGAEVRCQGSTTRRWPGASSPSGRSSPASRTRTSADCSMEGRRLRATPYLAMEFIEGVPLDVFCRAEMASCSSSGSSVRMSETVLWISCTS